MSNWLRTIDISKEWSGFDTGEVTLQEVAAKAASELENLKPYWVDYIDLGRLELAEAFQEIADDEDADMDSFDYAMGDLYDWADMSYGRDKVCWVRTIS